jgi:hypothetical protein
MLARPACRNITTAPPPARPVPLPRPAPLRQSTHHGKPLDPRIRQAVTRGAAGLVSGMLTGCLTGLVLGAACGFLFLLVLVVANSSGPSWSDQIVGGALFSVYAAVIGAIIGAFPGLFVGGVVGAASAVLHGGPAGRVAGLILGATLSPLLLAGSPWASLFLQVLMAAPGAVGGYRVAAVVGEKTRRLS